MSSQSRQVKAFIKNVRNEQIKEFISILEDKDEISWLDIKDSIITVKTWGEAIEKGIIIKSNTKNTYTVALLNELEEQFEQIEKNESSIDEKTIVELLNDKYAKITLLDKFIVTLVFISVLAFVISDFRFIYFEFINIIFGWVLLLPFYLAISFLAFITTIWSKVVTEKILDFQYKFKDYKKVMDTLKEEINKEEISVDTKNHKEEQLFNLQLNLFKLIFKTYIWRLVIVFPILIWISTSTQYGVGEVIQVPIIGTQVWSSQIIGPIQLWLIWYILSLLIIQYIVSKTSNLYNN